MPSFKKEDGRNKEIPLLTLVSCRDTIWALESRIGHCHVDGERRNLWNWVMWRSWRRVPHDFPAQNPLRWLPVTQTMKSSLRPQCTQPDTITRLTSAPISFLTTLSERFSPALLAQLPSSKYIKCDPFSESLHLLFPLLETHTFSNVYLTSPVNTHLLGEAFWALWDSSLHFPRGSFIPGLMCKPSVQGLNSIHTASFPHTQSHAWPIGISQ